jgi:hypothetical protein
MAKFPNRNRGDVQKLHAKSFSRHVRMRRDSWFSDLLIVGLERSERVMPYSQQLFSMPPPAEDFFQMVGDRLAKSIAGSVAPNMTMARIRQYRVRNVWAGDLVHIDDARGQLSMPNPPSSGPRFRWTSRATARRSMARTNLELAAVGAWNEF